MKCFLKTLPLIALSATSGAASDPHTTLRLSYAELGNFWEITERKSPQFPIKAIRNNTEGCAAIEFVIEPDGSTSHFRPLKGFPSGVFIKPSIKALKKWRFAPGTNNRDRQTVVTYIVFEFERTDVQSIEPEIPSEACFEETGAAFLAGEYHDES